MVGKDPLMFGISLLSHRYAKIRCRCKRRIVDQIHAVKQRPQLADPKDIHLVHIAMVPKLTFRHQNRSLVVQLRQVNAAHRREGLLRIVAKQTQVHHHVFLDADNFLFDLEVHGRENVVLFTHCPLWFGQHRGLLVLGKVQRFAPVGVHPTEVRKT